MLPLIVVPSTRRCPVRQADGQTDIQVRRPSTRRVEAAVDAPLCYLSTTNARDTGLAAAAHCKRLLFSLYYMKMQISPWDICRNIADIGCDVSVPAEVRCRNRPTGIRTRCRRKRTRYQPAIESQSRLYRDAACTSAPDG
ncbi:hypothetical protein EVAR_65944_1 [Eumeta japonica]|uniref:Uncharacterized protein n=1 Tax=Eumeta variegata TaxID=151549 RepID=A0A4C1ZJG5_EUMVA|nr:hypothetical protein EVAR_65944_1 [Eumeta japonica]